MKATYQLFFELLRVSLGGQKTLSRIPSKDEWKDLLRISQMQSLIGICFKAVQELKYNSDDMTCNLDVAEYRIWMGMTARIQYRNEVLSQNGSCLLNKLASDGFDCLILKGQSLAPFYGDLASFRQSGDIDVWCKGKSIEQLVAYVRNSKCKYEAKHAHVSYFSPEGIEVELHPTPGELRCPLHNRRLQKWFNDFNGSNLDFNLVYLMLHMYHHALFEGIGLRQFVDYYFVLSSNKVSETARKRAMDVITLLGMKEFSKAVMHIMTTIFRLNAELLLCKPDSSKGDILLREIMAGGNFGMFDQRYKNYRNAGLWVSAIGKMKKKLTLIRIAPWEVLCSPFWSVWQLAWRKSHKYF